jgi:peptide/nickel transport system permease protein
LRKQLAPSAAIRNAGPTVTAYIVRRLGWAIALFLVVTLYTYILFFLVPYHSINIGARDAGETGVASDVRGELGLQGGVVHEYGQFVWQIAHGDLGRSWISREPVTEVLWRAAPATASLVVGAAVLWLLIAFPIGILSALRPRSLIDRAGMVFILVGISAHPLWIGYILSYYFGYKLRWLPLNGYCDIFSASTACGGPVQWTYHLILPWATFSLAFAAIYARMIRASVIETLDEEFVRTARAKGLGEWSVLRGHVLRNAMLPVVTMLGMDLSVLWFSTAVFVERVFGLPGIGSLLYTALARRDMPVILGEVVLVTSAVIVLNLLADLIVGALDPRTRVVTRKRRAVRGAASAERASQPAVQQA